MYADNDHFAKGAMLSDGSDDCTVSEVILTLHRMSLSI